MASRPSWSRFPPITFSAANGDRRYCHDDHSMWLMKAGVARGRISTRSCRLGDLAENTPSAGRLAAIAAVA